MTQSAVYRLDQNTLDEPYIAQAAVSIKINVAIPFETVLTTQEATDLNVNIEATSVHNSVSI